MRGRGLVLLLVGLAIVVPAGGVSGPASRRHHDMGRQGIEATSDDRHHGRRAWYPVLDALIGLGALCFALAG